MGADQNQKDVKEMRHHRHIHPEEVMNPDLLSEALLIGSILMIVALMSFQPLRIMSCAKIF